MNKNYIIPICALLFLCIIVGCSDPQMEVRHLVEDTSNLQLLELQPSSTTGINFNNSITETKEFNTILQDGMLQGAGVAVLDANNDGLMDIYFAGNMVPDRLYINKGNFQFEDASASYGINQIKGWTTGLAVVDINGDGYDDIYVGRFIYDVPQQRQNLFLINDGNGKFVDKAKEMGVADIGYTIMANFFDMDRDGDLDLYVANQPPNSLQLKEKLDGKIDLRFTDRLYKNNNGRFVDITEQAGITNYTYSLSATSIDVDKDGWIDLYIACDYDEPDILYRNNGNGTFSNIANTAMKHISNFSMGADVADINNDGLTDIYIVDMVAEDNLRQKTNMSGMNPERFHALANAGYHYQYMFNTLQLNNGDNTFSDIAQLSGISNTDWSWSPLFIDVDQDGYRDLFVTNGLIKDVRNKDYEIWRKKTFEAKMKEAQTLPTKQLYLNPLELAEAAPSHKIPNYAYRNLGDLGFQKVSDSWGFSKPTWSQGSAYADFDNDGDMDMVINNMNMEADVYKNMANEKNLNNYLFVQLDGPTNNRKGINAKVTLTYAEEKQTAGLTPYRGYMSSSQAALHFGLGAHSIIDEITVIWPDNKKTVLANIPANQILTIKHAESTGTHTRDKVRQTGIFTAVSQPAIKHTENPYDDFEKQILLPYRTSTLGPIMTSGDVNGDGIQDIFYGGATGYPSQLHIGKGRNSFTEKPISGFIADKAHEDGGATFFDVDSDGDLDLYVSSGGNEFNIGDKNYQDRLYINDGSGNFKKSNKHPKLSGSNGTVVSFDIDGDKDMDLFVSGRQMPGKYGVPVDSYILQNNAGKLEDETSQLAPFLKDIGMVTDAQLGDLNGDGNQELVVVGEWMPLKIFSTNSKLTDISSNFVGKETNGWWNTVALEDIDGDNDLDLVVGNLGHNIKYKASSSEPFKVYVDDFDKNGSNDVYLGYYQNGQCYPVRGRQCSSEQLPFVKKKFATYQDFGLATIDKVLEDHISSTTVIHNVDTFSNTVFFNEGDQFKEVVLPNEAQISPVYGIAVDDFDKDGRTDIFLAGNMYQREVETTRSDAGKGCLLSYQDDGTFSVKRTLETGISADKDVRQVKIVKQPNANLLVIANNNDQAQFYRY